MNERPDGVRGPFGKGPQISAACRPVDWNALFRKMLRPVGLIFLRKPRDELIIKPRPISPHRPLIKENATARRINFLKKTYSNTPDSLGAAIGTNAVHEFWPILQAKYARIPVTSGRAPRAGIFPEWPYLRAPGRSLTPSGAPGRRMPGHVRQPDGTR